jgi:hypothetical protein
MSTDYDDRVEGLARELCQADGRNPDAQIRTGEIRTARSIQCQSSIEQQSVTWPAWKIYEGKARKLITACDAYLYR